jgi:hypothetical protein
MPTTYDSISTTTLSSGQTSITLSNIPATYTDLVLVVQGRTSTQSLVDCGWRANGDTGNNYSGTRFSAGSGGFGSDQSSNTNGANVVGIGLAQSVAMYYFMNYSNTTTFKTCLQKASVNISSTNQNVYTGVTLYRSTAAISSLEIYIPSGQSGNFVAGMTLSLYGIKAA